MAYSNDEKQKAGVGLSVSDTISVIGTGGFGGWVAFFGALSGVRRLILFSEGEVKDTDLAKLPYEPNHVGKPKAEAMADVIRRIRPDAVVEPHGPFDPAKHANLLEGVVFNGAPSPELEAATVTIAKERGLKYFTGVYSGLDFGAFDFTPENLKTTDEPGAFWAGTGASAAILALYSAFYDVVNFYGSPSKLAMSRAEIEEALGLKRQNAGGSNELLGKAAILEQR